MSESGRTAVSSRSSLRERIINTALQMFSRRGIRGITMDDIAASLGISKRTLYEVFADKESLLEACIRKRHHENETYALAVQASARNVLEVLLKCYQRSVEMYHATNRRFFEDIKKYPKVYQLMLNRQNRDSEAFIRFFREGVEQGIFRSDINFGIMDLLLREQLDMLMDTDICERYPFPEVYESIVFTYIRGISTEKGARELDDFIARSRAEREELPMAHR